MIFSCFVGAPRADSGAAFNGGIVKYFGRIGSQWGELAELRKFRVRRFRIIYQAEARSRTVRLLAVGPRRTVYEDLAAALKPPAGKPRSRG